MPTRAHPGDAGVDLYSAVDLELPPGRRSSSGPVWRVGPRRHGGPDPPPVRVWRPRTGLSIVNTPGTIDAGYRGEIKVCLINHDPDTPITIARGDRIAQLVVQRVELRVTEVAELGDTSRGTGGYGSSGGHAVLEG